MLQRLEATLEATCKYATMPAVARISKTHWAYGIPTCDKQGKVTVNGMPALLPLQHNLFFLWKSYAVNTVHANALRALRGQSLGGNHVLPLTNAQVAEHLGDATLDEHIPDQNACVFYKIPGSKAYDGYELSAMVTRDGKATQGIVRKKKRGGFAMVQPCVHPRYAQP